MTDMVSWNMHTHICKFMSSFHCFMYYCFSQWYQQAKQIVSWPVIKFPLLYETYRFITVFTQVCCWSLSLALQQHVVTSFSWIVFWMCRCDLHTASYVIFACSSGSVCITLYRTVVLATSWWRLALFRHTLKNTANSAS